MIRRLAVLAAVAVALPAMAQSGANTPPEKVTQVCSACHGVNGVAIAPIYPNLAGQYETYIANALHDYHDGKRKNAIMNAQAASLTNDDIKQLARWFSSQPAKVYTPEKKPPSGGS
jgi:cytochrome c553